MTSEVVWTVASKVQEFLRISPLAYDKWYLQLLLRWGHK